MLLVYQLHDTGIIQSQSTGIDILAVGIIAYYQYLRFFRIVYIQ